MLSKLSASGKTERGAGVVRCIDLLADRIEKKTTIQITSVVAKMQ
jgi:hypothetical protein